MIACFNPIANCFKDACTNSWKFLEGVVYVTCCGLNREPYEKVNQITSTCIQALKERQDHEHHHRELIKWQARQCRAQSCDILNAGTHNHDSQELRFLNAHLSQLTPHSVYARWLEQQMQRGKTLPQLISFAEEPYDRNCALCNLGKERALYEKEVIGASKQAIATLAFRQEANPA